MKRIALTGALALALAAPAAAQEPTTPYMTFLTQVQDCAARVGDTTTQAAALPECIADLEAMRVDPCYTKAWATVWVLFVIGQQALVSNDPTLLAAGQHFSDSFGDTLSEATATCTTP